MQQFVSPLNASPAQRAEASASLQDRIAGVMARVAADTTQTKATRAANSRDAASARRMASAMRARA